jgi:hypothetical protein
MWIHHHPTFHTCIQAGTHSSTGAEMKILKGMCLAIWYIYAASIFVMGPIYNWRYARENGFIKWVLLGEMVPTAKAIVWPYFEFIDKHNSDTNKKTNSEEWSTYEVENFKHMLQARDYDSACIRFTKSMMDAHDRRPETIRQIIELKKKVIMEGSMVNEQILEKLKQGTYRIYQDCFIGGLTLEIKGIEQGNNETLANGLNLHEKWIHYINDNQNSMNAPRDDQY